MHEAKSEAGQRSAIWGWKKKTWEASHTRAVGVERPLSLITIPLPPHPVLMIRGIIPCSGQTQLIGHIDVAILVESADALVLDPLERVFVALPSGSTVEDFY